MPPAAAGGALRTWPVFVLSHRFSGLVAIQPGHTLVTSGVYGVIRHLGSRVVRRRFHRMRHSFIWIDKSFWESSGCKQAPYASAEHELGQE
jgi:hypothetical protein